MKVRAQIMMVMNLDKCIGCHTCSVTCKNVWTNREGVEYAWFNNVETKPGIGYPRNWEDQQRWRGGWERTSEGALQLKIGGRLRVLGLDPGSCAVPCTGAKPKVTAAPAMPTRNTRRESAL